MNLDNSTNKLEGLLYVICSNRIIEQQMRSSGDHRIPSRFPVWTISQPLVTTVIRWSQQYNVVILQGHAVQELTAIYSYCSDTFIIVTDECVRPKTMDEGPLLDCVAQRISHYYYSSIQCQNMPEKTCKIAANFFLIKSSQYIESYTNRHPGYKNIPKIFQKYLISYIFVPTTQFMND